MIESIGRRWTALGLGALALIGGTFVLSTRSLAQDQGQTRPEGQIRRDSDVRREGPRDGDPRPGATLRRDQLGDRPDGRPGQPGFQFGQPGFPGMGPGMGPMMMGGPTMTATATTVYVLRGNTLMAFDANTLRLKARTELPQPEFRPMGPGGPGGPGFPGGGPGGPGVPGGGQRFE